MSCITVIPLGDCVCGERDTIETNITPLNSEEEEVVNNQRRAQDLAYFSCGDASKRSFLRGSLFVDFGDEDGTCIERRCSYDILWESHLEQVTEESMLERTPAMSMDLLYQLDLPHDFDSENLSVISDLENSAWNERFVCRLVIGPASLNVCSGSVHRLATIAHLSAVYLIAYHGIGCHFFLEVTYQ